MSRKKDEPNKYKIDYKKPLLQDYMLYNLICTKFKNKQQQIQVFKHEYFGDRCWERPKDFFGVGNS